MEIAYLDGKWMPIGDAKVSVFDRGFMFGDGVYEVIPFFNGRAVALEKHLLRLSRSLDSVSLSFPNSQKIISDLITEGLKRFQDKKGLIYVQVTRGIQTPRDHKYQKNSNPTLLITLSKKDDLGCADATPISVTIKNDFRWGRADIKVTSLIANVMLKNQAINQGFDDVILLRDGKVTEATTANVFAIKRNVIFTPEKSNYLLHGITRDLVIDLCLNHKFDVREEPITENFLLVADEVWLTSSGSEIRPVSRIGEKILGENAWNRNSTWAKVYQLYIDKFYR